jgi:poly-gamma-glutamate system protein
MKAIYWRPRGISPTALVLVAVLALMGLAAVELFQRKVKQPNYLEKLHASRLAREAFDVIKAERLRRGLAIDPETDPAQSGLIGELMTSVTSNTGVLRAKQTTVNPNFAAVLVNYFKKVGCEEGDVVAVGLSGSFPALNICVYAAIQTLKLKPIIISSGSASQWGANVPQLLWIDMEQVLYDRRLFSFRSIAASVGGIEDKGLGMSDEGIALIRRTIAGDQLPLLQPSSYTDSINQRMKLFREQAGDRPIKIYVNVGGGTTSVGTIIGKRQFKPGLNYRAPQRGPEIDSIMHRFVEEGVPVVHLTKIEELAGRFGLPVMPTTIPVVGEGKIFKREQYNPWLTAGVLLGILIALYAFIRSDWGFRMQLSARRRHNAEHPEPMV